MFPFMLVHPEDPDLVQMPGLGVNEVVHCGQGEGVDHVPTHSQYLRHRGDGHFLDRQAMENPAGGAAGSGGFRSSDPVYALAEHRYRTAVLLADEPR